MKYFSFFLFTSILIVVQTVLAGPCETISTTGTRMELVDFGIAYSEDFRFNSRDDKLDFYNGVCIKQEVDDVWQLEAESIVIENVSVELELTAEFVSFQFDGWILTADYLLSGQDLFIFETVNLQKGDMTIDAANLRLDLLTDEFSLADVSAVYRDEFQISGEAMNIVDDQVIFDNAFVTSCMCTEGRLYDIRSPSIVYDDSTNTLTLSETDLVIGDSIIPLGDSYIISDEIDLEFPTPFVAYSTDLELALKGIALAKGLKLDVGAKGVDTASDFKPYGLVNFGLNESNSPDLGGRLTGTVGKAVDGLQADLTYVTSFDDKVSLDIGTRNQHWPAAGYLHDVFAGLSYRTVPLNNVLETGILEVVTRIYGAFTHQEVSSETVLGPRLGVKMSNGYAYGSMQQGLITFAVIPEATYYPVEGEFQYALSLVPSFSIASNGFSFSTRYDHKITNASSPFDIDRASEARTLNMSAGLQETGANGHSFSVSTNAIIDFLKDAELNQSPVRTIGLNINSTIKGSEEGLWEIKPYIQAELARLVTGIEDTSLDDAYNEDYIQFGIDSSVGDWQYGIRTRVNPTIQVDEDFVEVFELGIGVPFRQGDLLLRPYIGVNFVSLFTDAYEFDVSTYGFSAYYECCGNTSSFFEVRDGNLTTGLVLPF